MQNDYLHLENIRKQYPDLIFDKSLNTLKGNINICKKCNDEIIKKNYSILIDLNSKPIPAVYDIGKNIKKSYPHRYKDRRLCLATDIEQILFIKQHKDISAWIKYYVESYFISYEYFMKYGIYPFGEYSHGREGIVEFYLNYFNLNQENNSKEILNYIFLNHYRGHNLCPCGSGRKIRNCHKEIVLKCQNDSNIETLKNYYRRMIL